MGDWKLGVIETRFAEIIWANEPLSSGELVRLCQQELNWKKSTTYTVLRKLCQRGLFQNEEGTVSALISRDDFYARQTEEFVEETFSGSLPAFLTSFTARKKLSEEDVQQLQALIDRHREEQHD